MTKNSFFDICSIAKWKKKLFPVPKFDSWTSNRLLSSDSFVRGETKFEKFSSVEICFYPPNVQV